MTLGVSFEVELYPTDKRKNHIKQESNQKSCQTHQYKSENAAEKPIKKAPDQTAVQFFHE